ncbi:hypothetical protein BZJ19_16985, partial [Salinivibrio proteolyticus]|uniref:hypothetical protein n=1 Tax=Salinivibrio proteolyticus TaxID=334715 RepID=UPI0009C9F878
VIILLAYGFNLKRNFIFILLFAIPMLPVVSQQVMSNLSSLGGLFEKIDNFSDKDYNNTLVYIKVFILYFSLIFFYLYSAKSDLFDDHRFMFIYKVYLMVVVIVVFSLPVLLLSSRYLYYASAYLPVLFTFIFYEKKGMLSLEARFFGGGLIALCIGLFVYSFQSVRIQLGL